MIITLPEFCFLFCLLLGYPQSKLELELLVSLGARTSLVDGLCAAGGMGKEHHCEDGDSGDGDTSGGCDSGDGYTSGGCDG